MDVALQSSVWVTSPEFSGWLIKKGFYVSHYPLLRHPRTYYVKFYCVVVEEAMEEKVGGSPWGGNCLYGKRTNCG
jgi:hypothetical protein